MATTPHKDLKKLCDLYKTFKGEEPTAWETYPTKDYIPKDY